MVRLTARGTGLPTLSSLTPPISTGGLVGQNDGAITNSYSTANVSGTEILGGLEGQQAGNITNAYATGLVANTAQSAGLVGYQDNGFITNSFFDTQTTGQPNGIPGPPFGGATGETTANMQKASTFKSPPANWDFTDTWGISPSINNGYPYLLMFFPNGVQGQLPEVPFAGLLPFTGLAGAGAFILARRRKEDRRFASN